MLLNPRKAKEFIPEVALELSHASSLIEDVVDFYYQEIRRSLSALSHSRVHLSNLGDFTLKHWNIDDKIEMLEKWEENNRQKGLQQMQARFKTAENLFDLKRVQKIVEEEKQRKEFIILHKKKAHEIKKHIPDMEK